LPSQKRNRDCADFSTVGLGLAAPYVVLSWNPAWLKLLPKPGAWMEKFKIAMGFPMLLTAVWLFNLAADDYGSNVLWLGVFLVLWRSPPGFLASLSSAAGPARVSPWPLP
jgi:thiol:disulfide interchange protein